MSKAKLVVALLGGLALPLAAVAADTNDQAGDPSTRSQPAGDPSGAQGRAGDTVAPMFQQLDADHDGFISQTEAKKSATAMGKFKTLDANHDGKVSPAEWSAGGMN